MHQSKVPQDISYKELLLLHDTKMRNFENISESQVSYFEQNDPINTFQNAFLRLFCILFFKLKPE